MTDTELERLRSLTCIKWTIHPDDVLPAWVADMDLAPAPVVVDAVRALVDRGDFGYNWHAAKQLPEAFSAWQSRRHSWTPDPRQVRVFCDVMQGVDVALMTRCKPGDGVICFTPIYPPFLHSSTVGDRQLIDCPLDPDGWRIDRAALELAASQPNASAILLCNPHNPTGRAFSREELELVADAAIRHDLLIVSDEIWCDLVYSGAAHIPIASLFDEVARRTVTLTAASKAFNIAGLHCAVAHLGDRAVRKAVDGLPGHVLGAVGSPGAEATLAAWTCGEPWLAETKIHLQAMRDHLAARLSSELPDLRFTIPEATYLAWLDFRAFDLGDNPAAALLERGRVALSSGPDFGEHGFGWARLNFATTTGILDQLVDRVIAGLGIPQGNG